MTKISTINTSYITLENTLMDEELPTYEVEEISLEEAVEILADVVLEECA